MTTQKNQQLRDKLDSVDSRANQPRPTQGQAKMLRYIEDLIRNKQFKRLIKRLRNLSKLRTMPKGNYYDWTLEEQKKHDGINNELHSIAQGYEALRKRCKKVLRKKDSVVREKIASDYGLDNDLINHALALLGKNEETIKWSKKEIDPDMCKLIDLYEEEMSPLNKGEEIIYLNLVRQLLITAYPVAIAIHPRASKRDVLDYIEKRWKWIDAKQWMFNQKGALKIKKRKHSQEMIDFIWANRSLPAKQIEKKLNKKFPNNELVYYEISKIIQIEKQRRFKDLTATEK